MKLLIVHNAYGKPSGEEAVVENMAAAFAERGVEVQQLRMTTEGMRESLSGQVRGFVSGLYCPSGVRAMRQALECFRPDVVNVHNLYPFISPAALRECKRQGVPVVMTVHNFRLMCPTGLFMRSGVPCEDCLRAGNEWRCVWHNCEHSLLKSLGYAARNAVARWHRYYKDCVDRFACITEFQRRKLIEAGFPADKLLVIPNAVNTHSSDSRQDPNICAITPYVAFCGRLSREKGVDLIIEVARRHPEITFKLAGAVRDAELIAHKPTNVELVGYVTGTHLRDFYRQARFVLMASRCYEGFPMAILEAACEYRPTLAPDHGGFTEIITDGAEPIGRLFRPGDVDDLERQVLALWNNPDTADTLGRAAHTKLQQRYAMDVVTTQWLTLLSSLCSNS